MKVHLNDENLKGEIVEIYNAFNRCLLKIMYQERNLKNVQGKLVVNFLSQKRKSGKFCKCKNTITLS
jgi:hypothetical protein